MAKAKQPQRIQLAPERRKELVAQVKAWYDKQFDEEVGDLKAGFLVDYFIALVGPSAYNQGVKDAQAFMQDKLMDLEGEVYEPDLEFE